jgi:branched-chain amino acid transport system ATP-binding protein
LAADAILEVDALGAAYGPVQVLRSVSWSLQRGTCLALLGANGSGKTTMLRGLAGAMVRRTGSVRFDGAEIAGLPAHEIARRGLALVPEGRHLFPQLTVEENLRAGAFILRKQRRSHEQGAAFDAVFHLFPRLAERRAQAAGTLSGGEQQMLAVARALMGKPQALLLDEPSVGIAPLVIEEMFRAFARLKDEGMTIVVAEQRVPPALQLADRVLVLQLGKVVIDAPSKQVADSTELRRLYLGG